MEWKKYIQQNIMSQADFHTHTTYSDGNAIPEEMVQSAIKMGLKTYGFSGHGYTFYDESYCMMPDQIVDYHKEVKMLAEKYSDKINILCGLEQDLFAGKSDIEWDYVIGSVHYIKCGEEYIPIDKTPEIITDAVNRYFNGDIYGLTRQYFETVSTVCEMTAADLIGHFDLITKFNWGGEGDNKGILFDERDVRYVEAWKKAADILMEKDVPFEINTAGISSGLRTDAYPSEPIREYLKAKGAKFILSSDSHSTATLCFGFNRMII